MDKVKLCYDVMFMINDSVKHLQSDRVKHLYRDDVYKLNLFANNTSFTPLFVSANTHFGTVAEEQVSRGGSIKSMGCCLGAD